MRIKVWAQYDKDLKQFTGEISVDGRPITSPAYKKIYSYRHCWMTLKEIKPLKGK